MPNATQPDLHDRVHEAEGLATVDELKELETMLMDAGDTWDQLARGGCSA